MNDDEKHETVLAAIRSLQGATEFGFAQVDARFAQVDARFAQMDARFDRVESRLTSVEGEVRGMRHWRDLVDARLA